MKKWLLAKLSDSTIKTIATAGPCGYCCKCPGTIGSAIGLLWYILAFSFLNGVGSFLLFTISTIFGIVICTEAERIIGKTDPNEVIIDEIIAIPMCFFGINIFASQSHTIFILLFGFLLFRFFDIKKPFGINKIQSLSAGYGVMLDDTIAALYTNVVMQLTLVLFF